jgi:hypothetical protein
MNIVPKQFPPDDPRLSTDACRPTLVDPSEDLDRPTLAA